MMLARYVFLSSLLPVLCLTPAEAKPTEIVVRVLSKDAKFVGTAMGGAEITLRDADTGEVLARGLTAGGTGSTPKIMTTPHGPRDVLSDSDAAKYSVTLDLDRPRKITATAVGPMVPREAAMSVSSTQWVVPGKPVSGGDAWLLELRGFAVSLIGPPPGIVALTQGSARVPLKVKVTMMCGCPIEPAGMWNADKMEVAAIIAQGAGSSAPVALSYAGATSTFGGEITITRPGEHVVHVYAYDPANGNTGVSRFTLRAQ